MAAEPLTEFDDDIRRAAAGDNAAWQSLIARVHPRLRRMVAVRLDHRLGGRVDPSDVLQESYIDAMNQLGDYLKEPKIPFFLWLRLVTGHRLAKLHRFHLGAQVRDASREVSLFHGYLPEASSAALAAHLLGHELSPSQAACEVEQCRKLQEILNQMDETDREVLSLRHFEWLTTAEVADVLGITPAAAGKRYLRALDRLKDVLVLRGMP